MIVLYYSGKTDGLWEIIWTEKPKIFITWLFIKKKLSSSNVDYD